MRKFRFCRVFGRNAVKTWSSKNLGKVRIHHLRGCVCLKKGHAWIPEEFKVATQFRILIRSESGSSQVVRVTLSEAVDEGALKCSVRDSELEKQFKAVTAFVELPELIKSLEADE